MKKTPEEKTSIACADLTALLGQVVRIETRFAGGSGDYTGVLDSVDESGICLMHKEAQVLTGTHGLPSDSLKARLFRKDGRAIGSLGRAPLFTCPLRAIVSAVVV